MAFVIAAKKTIIVIVLSLIVSLSLLKNQLSLSFYRFIAIAVNFSKKNYRLSLSQTFLIVLSLSQVRKLVIAESTD